MSEKYFVGMESLPAADGHNYMVTVRRGADGLVIGTAGDHEGHLWIAPAWWTFVKA